MNKLKLLMGRRIDPSLNAAGREQAAELSRQIGFDYDVIFSSPLKRAMETAQILKGDSKTPLITREELTEKDLGSMSGKKWEETHLKSKFDHSPFGGESPHDMSIRLKFFMDDVKKDHAHKKVLAVTHGGVIRMLHRIFHDKEIDHIPNTSVHEFEI